MRTSSKTMAPTRKKKIAFLVSAMRHVAEELRAEGILVDYVTLDDPENSQSLKGEAARALRRHGLSSLVFTEPGEWSLSSEMAGWAAALGVPVEIRGDERFLCSQSEFAAWAKGRKTLRMEFFYREMRRKTGLLMNGDKPEGEMPGRGRHPGRSGRPPLHLHPPAA